ncbi:MAG: 30S ribosomal protein S4 [Verrucomicrobiae bacterium]|nr:30S ribosomal protein S4 [Verrucomicrobiae bacterium]
MGRYTGPRIKVCRRHNAQLFGASKYLERKNYPPGMHGPKSRRKLSEYGLALSEKQKLRYMYGLFERQFRHVFRKAQRTRGVTGETLLQLLETRLDNVVFRLGFARTRPFSRQMVVHGHVRVNKVKVTSPSYNVRAGDVIEIRENAKTKAMVQKSLELNQAAPVPDWLAVDREGIKGEVKRIPTREEIAPIVNERLVVELYSR